MPTSWRSLLAPACEQCRSWMDGPCRHVSQQECRHIPATVTARRPKTDVNQCATTPAPAGFVADAFQPAHVAQGTRGRHPGRSGVLSPGRAGVSDGLEDQLRPLDLAYRSVHQVRADQGLDDCCLAGRCRVRCGLSTHHVADRFGHPHVQRHGRRPTPGQGRVPAGRVRGCCRFCGDHRSGGRDLGARPSRSGLASRRPDAPWGRWSGPAPGG